MNKNLKAKIKYYAIDFPYCMKSALINTFRIMVVVSVLGFFILILQGEAIEDVLNTVYDSLVEGTVRIYVILLLLITGLRFYSKFVYWKKNENKKFDASELHNRWKDQ